MKRLIALFLAAALALSLAACGGNGGSPATGGGDGSSQGSGQSTPVSSQEPLKYVFIHSASLGSQSFADVVDKGLKEAAAAFGAEYSIIENVETSAVADTLRTVIASGSHLVIIAVNT